MKAMLIDYSDGRWVFAPFEVESIPVHIRGYEPFQFRAYRPFDSAGKPRDDTWQVLEASTGANVGKAAPTLKLAVIAAKKLLASKGFGLLQAAVARHQLANPEFGVELVSYVEAEGEYCEVPSQKRAGTGLVIVPVGTVMEKRSEIRSIGEPEGPGPERPELDFTVWSYEHDRPLALVQPGSDSPLY